MLPPTSFVKRRAETIQFTRSRSFRMGGIFRFCPFYWPYILKNSITLRLLENIPPHTISYIYRTRPSTVCMSYIESVASFYFTKKKMVGKAKPNCPLTFLKDPPDRREDCLFLLSVFSISLLKTVQTSIQFLRRCFGCQHCKQRRTNPR